MLHPIEPRQIVARWAAQPLDFAPGTAWQYSNTGYTIAGIIAEKAAGKPLFRFLQERIFVPLKMTSVVDFDAAPLPAGDATGYMRYALGPLRPAAKEGRGWLFAAGELAMTAADLARWDIGVIRHELLATASYRELTGEVRLANGAGTGYALGLDVELKSGKRILRHGGEVGGFTAENRIYPDDGIAVVVLTNQDATEASSTIADALADLLLLADSPSQSVDAGAAKDLFKQLQSGKIDRQRLTGNANSYFTSQALEDYRTSLSPLGEPTSFILKRSAQRGGFATHVYEAAFPTRRSTSSFDPPRTVGSNNTRSAPGRVFAAEPSRRPMPGSQCGADNWGVSGQATQATRLRPRKRAYLSWLSLLPRRL